MKKDDEANQKMESRQKPLQSKNYSTLFGALFATSVIALTTMIYSEFLGVVILIFGFVYFGGDIYYKIISKVFSKK
jgi:hypothetical protein